MDPNSKSAPQHYYQKSIDDLVAERTREYEQHAAWRPFTEKLTAEKWNFINIRSARRIAHAWLQEPTYSDLHAVAKSIAKSNTPTTEIMIDAFFTEARRYFEEKGMDLLWKLH